MASISPSTNLVLIDASAQRGTLTLPNPSTLDGKILIIRDLSNTFSAESTLSLLTPTTNTLIATLSLPSSFITLVAAPQGNRQYHIIGGNYIQEQNVSSVVAPILSTSLFQVTQSYTFQDPAISTFQTVSTFIDTVTASTLSVSNILFASNASLTASNSALYLNNQPLSRGKFYTVQEIQGQQAAMPFRLTNPSSAFPLLWLDPTDSNMMFTDDARTTHPTVGEKIQYWYVKPSTLGIFAVQSNLTYAPYYQGSQGLWFSTLSGMTIINSNLSACNDTSLPVAADSSMYLVTTPSSNVQGYQFASTYNTGATPALLNGYIFASGFYYNGSNQTPLNPNETGFSWYTASNDSRPIQLPATSGSNLITMIRGVSSAPSNILQLNYNGSNRYTGRSLNTANRWINLLGREEDGAIAGPVCFYGDILIYNDKIHTRPEQQIIESWLAARWNIQSKLPSDHLGYAP